MLRRPFVFLLATSLLSSFGLTSTAEAGKKPQVVWAEVTVREGADRAKREKQLEKILKKEAKRANWGTGQISPIEASVTIKELTAVRDGDVVRVTCTGVGRLMSGQAVKSRFSFGGHPEEQEKLHLKILELVGRGIVTRLAEIARAKAPDTKKKAHPAG
jgi:hypothetical protein